MDIAWLRSLHLLGAVVWVGGMFFAQFALRPSAAALAPPQRLPLLAAVMRRFVAWAGVAIVLIVASGGALLHASGGLADAGPGVHAMIGLGIAMVAVYAYASLVALRRLRIAVEHGDWSGGGRAMNTVRVLIAVNLVLGLAAVVLGGFAR
jgi:uncharacterized membrane protein